MTSAKRLKANRTNAKHSTGPKTARGKARAAQNARSHGLSVSLLNDPIRSAELDSLALKIAGEGASSELLDLARRIAESQIELVRVRRARNGFLAREPNDPEYGSKELLRSAKKVLKIISYHLRPLDQLAAIPPYVVQFIEHVKTSHRPNGEEKPVRILSDVTQRFILLERYERRALSRRKFAIRDFDNYRKQNIRAGAVG